MIKKLDFSVSSKDFLYQTVKHGVCKWLNLDYFTFYYAGDNLDSVEWEERSLKGEVEIDKKKEVMNLALNLAVKINKK